MPIISDVRHFMLIYDPNTLTASIWDGSLHTGALVIGSVSQNGTWTVGLTKSGTATTSQVADNAASVTLLASNTNRLGATIENDSTAILYAKLGTTATTSDYTVQIFPSSYYEVPFGYTGRIDGIWATDPNTGSARVTELT